jgi:hypothetical protein
MTGHAAELAALRDIHVPPPPGWWPPAGGWWLLLVLILAVIVWRTWRRWTRFRLHRELVDLLDQLALADGRQPEQQRLIRLSRLLRQIALRRFPHAQVASLTGTDWLAFLDASGGGSGFRTGPGRVLADGPYQRQPTDEVDWPALVRLVRAWLASSGAGRHAA